jgi:hypothetical protein
MVDSFGDDEKKNVDQKLSGFKTCKTRWDFCEFTINERASFAN